MADRGLTSAPAAGKDSTNDGTCVLVRYYMAWFAFYVLRGSDTGAGGGAPGYGGQSTVPSITGSMLRVRDDCCMQESAIGHHAG